jgi:hypothetical protein
MGNVDEEQTETSRNLKWCIGCGDCRHCADIIRNIFAYFHTNLSHVSEAYEYDPELGVRHRSGIHLFHTTDYQEQVKVNQL